MEVELGPIYLILGAIVGIVFLFAQLTIFSIYSVLKDIREILKKK